MALDAVAQRSGVCSTSAACHTQNLRGIDHWRGSRAPLAALQRLSRSTGHRKGRSKKNMSCTKAQATATALSTERQPGKWSSTSPGPTLRLVLRLCRAAHCQRSDLYDDKGFVLCSESRDSEEGDKGDKSRGQHKSRWDRCVQLQLTDSLLGPHDGRKSIFHTPHQGVQQAWQFQDCMICLLLPSRTTQVCSMIFMAT